MSVLLSAPILLTLTLLVSGLAKLGARQATEDAMTSLRLPLRPFHRSVASVLPVAEIVLALALWIPSVPLQVMVAVLVALLMIAYLVIIARALFSDEQVECSCFGNLASPTVSRITLGRNVLLVVLAALTLIAAGSGAMTVTLVQAPLSLIALGVALGLAIVLTALTLGGTDPEAARAGTDADAARSTARPSTAPSGAGSAAPGDDDANNAHATGGDGSADLEEELLGYERSPIPGAVLQLPGG